MMSGLLVRSGGVFLVALAFTAGWARSAEHVQSSRAQVAGGETRVMTLTGTDARDGRPLELKLDSKEDRFAVLAFVSVRCLCSPDQMLALKELKAHWSERGFRFAMIDVSQDSTPSDRQKYYRSFDFPIFWDQGFKISDRFAVAKTPWVQVVDRSGAPVYAGTVLDNDGNALLEPALASLDQGQAPKLVEDKRFGCALKPLLLMPDEENVHADATHHHMD